MVLKKDEKLFYTEIKTILEKTRSKVYKAVNSAMLEVYWQIGKKIVKEEQNGKERADYGEYLIKKIFKKLSSEFGKGFSLANLKNFRQFYLVFPDFKKSYALRSQLSWTHLRLLMRVDNKTARDYYIKECADQNWSTRQLDRNIHTHYYERLLSSNNKKELLLKELNFEKYNKNDFIKDPYVLNFLNLSEETSATEKKIERAIIDNKK